LYQIFVANPWLDGRFVSGEGKLTLVYNKIEETNSIKNHRSKDSFLTVVDFLEVSPTMPIWEQGSKFVQYKVKKGEDIVDKDEPLFKVTLILRTEKPASQNQSTASDSWCIVVSLSHGAGDGHTLYSLCNMLDKQAPVIAMSCTRKAVQDKIEEKIGSLNIEAGKIPFIFQNKSDTFIEPQPFVIKNSWIKEQKEKFGKATSGGFVSSNDIISSWFMNITGCDFGALAFNFRNRILEINDLDAGNYISSIALLSSVDFSDPSSVRKVVNSCRSTVGILPSSDTQLRNNSSIITNWSTSCKLPEHEGNLLVFHSPVCFNEAKIGTDYSNICILFKADKDSLGVFIFTAAKAVAERFRNESNVLTFEEFLAEKQKQPNNNI